MITVKKIRISWLNWTSLNLKGVMKVVSCGVGFQGFHKGTWPQVFWGPFFRLNLSKFHWFEFIEHAGSLVSYGDSWYSMNSFRLPIYVCPFQFVVKTPLYIRFEKKNHHAYRTKKNETKQTIVCIKRTSTMTVYGMCRCTIFPINTHKRVVRHLLWNTQSHSKHTQTNNVVENKFHLLESPSF